MSKKTEYELKLDPLKCGGLEISTTEERGGKGEFRRRRISVRALTKNPDCALDFSIEHYTAKRGKGDVIRYRKELVSMEIPRELFDAFFAEIKKGAKWEG